VPVEVSRFKCSISYFHFYFRDSMSIFGGAPLPWTSSAANKIGTELLDKTATKPAVASKKLSPEEMARLKVIIALQYTKFSTALST
jgi:hypothetical protein